MKPIICLLFTGLFTMTGYTQEIDDAQIEFVNRFKTAVLEHKPKKVFKYLDKAYRTEQLKFLKGNKEQLLNELFGGNDGEKYKTIPINEIMKFEVAEVVEKENGSFDYIFRVRDANSDIMAPLLLVKRGKKFGFVGASG